MCQPGRRPRSRSHRRGDRGREGLRPPFHHRLQDGHRLRFAQQAGHGQHPRRASGRRRSRRDPRAAWLDRRAVRSSVRNPRHLAHGRTARLQGAPGLAGSAWQGRSRAEHRRRVRPPGGGRYLQQSALAGAIDAFKSEAAAEQPALATRTASQRVLDAIVPGRDRDHRRIGGSHRLQQHQVGRHAPL